MIRESKAYEILKGARGRKPLNLTSLAKIIVKLSKLSMENKKIKEVDLNPVIADQKKALIVDAKVIEE